MTSTAPGRGAPVSIVWFRRDLRLEDNPALWAAAARGFVIPLFVATRGDNAWNDGAASRWWLHHSLASLDASMREHGSRLVLRIGDPVREILTIARRFGADAVFWNRRYEPNAIAGDARVRSALAGEGLAAESHNAVLLVEPWEIKTQSDTPFRVFSSFWKSLLARGDPPPPIGAPKRIHLPENVPITCRLADLDLLPRRDWAAGLRQTWQPGEPGAKQALSTFVRAGIRTYAAARDTPGMHGTSRLSPHLHWGEISPRQVWQTLRNAAASPGGAAGRWGDSRETFLRELGWREFAHHLLFHFPHTTDVPLDQRFESFGWRCDPDGLKAWRQGRTGYPIVDAGMRELWHTGWMHNRVRMIVASFLVKHLLISWREGAKWFWDTLVDADLANNTLGWQWTAGCGADAAPFFRMFNPTLQGEKFDPEGIYVRCWVPELARLADRWIHRPWQAPTDVLRTAGVRLGTDYPRPVVEHAEARRRALAAFERIKTSAACSAREL